MLLNVYWVPGAQFVKQIISWVSTEISALFWNLTGGCSCMETN